MLKQHIKNIQDEILSLPSCGQMVRERHLRISQIRGVYQLFLLNRYLCLQAYVLLCNLADRWPRIRQTQESLATCRQNIKVFDEC